MRPARQPRHVFTPLYLCVLNEPRYRLIRSSTNLKLPQRITSLCRSGRGVSTNRAAAMTSVMPDYAAVAPIDNEKPRSSGNEAGHLGCATARPAVTQAYLASDSRRDCGSVKPHPGTPVVRHCPPKIEKAPPWERGQSRQLARQGRANGANATGRRHIGAVEAAAKRFVGEPQVQKSHPR